MRLCPLALTLAAAYVEARRHSDTPHKVKESIPGPPHGWQIHGPAHPNHIIELKIALPQPHFPILEQHLWEISDPDHERYGGYLSKEETEALMAPHPETLDVVSEWLSSHGIEEEHLYRSSAQDWVTVRVPVALAEKMLNTEYHVYTHSDSGEKIVRTTSYSLPVTVHEHVELIQPTTMFSRNKPFRSTMHWEGPVEASSDSSGSTGTVLGPAGNQVDASCNSMITTSCLKQLYNAVGYETSDSNGNRIGVTGYLEQYANDDDLQSFDELMNITGSTYSQVLINGGSNSQTLSAAGDEADLDVQYAFGLTHPTPGIFYSTGGLPPYDPDLLYPQNQNEPYFDWLNYTLEQEYLPQTISTSYGDNEQTVPKSYATRVCNGFATLGARGVTLLFASGDYGVGDGDSNPATQQCIIEVNGHNKTEFIPSFPASCPYVTSVGATRNIPETAVSFSGGGFSNYFSRPSYQDSAVNEYLKTALAPGTYKGLFNSNGRGIPDVAAQGVNYEIVYRGEKTRIDGTSASTPTFAAIVSMLNDALICAGKKPLGFMNPWLYKKGFNGLNDITTGSNPGCGTQGFNASKGWDPLTGLGTPNFYKLRGLC